MPSDPLILAFDTSAAHCAVALISGAEITSSRAEQMARGQAERLLPMLQEMLMDAGLSWRDLSALGVGIGPGNFTGIRIAVSAARGLALGLDIPAVGVSGCEARSLLAGPLVRPTIPAPRDMVYLCNPDDPTSIPEMMTRQDAQTMARKNRQTLGPENSPRGLAEAIARITASRWQTTGQAPAPLYARAADAAPSGDMSPLMLD